MAEYQIHIRYSLLFMDYLERNATEAGQWISKAHINDAAGANTHRKHFAKFERIFSVYWNTTREYAEKISQLSVLYCLNNL